jgi:hypothetical protein
LKGNHLQSSKGYNFQVVNLKKKLNYNFLKFKDNFFLMMKIILNPITFALSFQNGKPSNVHTTMPCQKLCDSMKSATKGALEYATIKV